MSAILDLVLSIASSAGVFYSAIMFAKGRNIEAVYGILWAIYFLGVATW